MLSAAAFVIALGCVAASALRLRYAVTPTSLSPEVLLGVLSPAPPGVGLDRLEHALDHQPEARWERAVLASLRAPSPAREALVNEQLTELDYLIQRWVRVPRVCASICTSSGFLLAATLLRTSLAGPAEPLDPGAVDAAVLQAIDVAAIGLAGAAFCVALQMRARREAKASQVSFDRLVARLEAEASAGRKPAPGSQAPIPEPAAPLGVGLA